MRTAIFTGSALFLILSFAHSTATAQAKKTPIILDTDIGSDVDDAFALALAAASPELELVAVTTCAKQANDRAFLVCRFLTQVGVKKLPVAFGRSQQPDYGLDWQIQYRRHPAAIFNRTLRPVKSSAVDLIHAKLKERPGKITLVCVGPLTNAARLLKAHPDAKRLIKRIVIMGGSIEVGYGGRKKPEPEWNIKSDIPAAQAVFASGVPLTVVPLDATATVALNEAKREHLFRAQTLLTFQVQNLYELWDKKTPVLYDPVAIAAVFDQKHLTLKPMCLAVNDKGMTKVSSGKPNATVATAIQKDEFVSWFVDRLCSVGTKAVPKAPKNRSDVIEDFRFPTRVHSWEDYDADIEKRWWMCGKLDAKDHPRGGRRACRAVLTQDFDARMGDMKAMYRAVIFNPVPGPPMGPKTRLSFSYKLTGADTIRIQLYSLSKGYHRYLSIRDVHTGHWAQATVDMTKMRRPDGSGGPLSENERIDDIQFYIDPRAELLIDDIVLYEAGSNSENRPFPKRILFSGWFDTGKQGVHWPGEFEIVKHQKPRTWRAARSVIRKSTGKPWIRLGLRGERRLGSKTELFFRYRVNNSEKVKVELFHTKSKRVVQSSMVALSAKGWQHAELRFAGPAGKNKAGNRFVDEVRFYLPAGSDMFLDDVLLYEPGMLSPP